MLQLRTAAFRASVGMDGGEQTNSQGERNNTPPPRLSIIFLTWAVLHSFDENIIDLMRDYPKAYDFISEKITHTPGRLCGDLETWDRDGGREAQEGGDMGIYVCI